MSFKTFFQLTVLVTVLAASFAIPGNAQAWSNCGNTYVVQWGDTLGGIAAYCGTTVAELYAVNPGISGYLYAGQVLVMPGGDYTDTYVVQRGDSFSEIAKRFGVSTSSLWAANPYVWDINRIYPGQVLNVPASSGYTPVNNPTYQTPSSWFVVSGSSASSADELIPRSYGMVAPHTPTGNVKLINIASAEVYISLQGTTNDGAHVINEYPVEGVMKVNVPSGWYLYVAWIGGEKYSGEFKLGADSNHTITFYPHRVNVE